MTAPLPTESAIQSGIRLAQKEAAERLTDRVRRVWALLEDDFSKTEDLASLYGELHWLKKHTALPDAQRQTLNLMKTLIEKEVGSRGYSEGYFRRCGKLKIPAEVRKEIASIEKKPGRKPGPKPAAKVAKKRGRKPGPKAK